MAQDEVLQHSTLLSQAFPYDEDWWFGLNLNSRDGTLVFDDQYAAQSKHSLYDSGKVQ